MKMKYIIICIIAIIIILLLIFKLELFKDKKVIKEEKIQNINSIEFNYTTGYHYNGSISYEIQCNEECILYYKGDGISEEDKKKYIIDKEVVKDIENKLNEYKVIDWNNFYESNQYVLDGNSFYIKITYDNDKQIIARGYESWPNNYRYVREYINNALSKYMNN